MPTLVWIRRPECGTSGAGGDGASNGTGRREKTVPESVVSAVVAVDVVSPTDGEKKKKRMTNGAKAAAVAKKRSKATRERELPTGVKKTRGRVVQWTNQEDAIVVDAVSTSAEQPFTRWRDLASKLPGRKRQQIRDRWVNHLNPSINHMPFSREDDLLLWNGNKEFGKRWVEISTKRFNSSRSENHIKNRWYSASFKKFIANEFGSDAYAETAIPVKPATKSKAKA